MGMWGSIGSGIATQGGADWSIGLSLIGRAVAQGDYNRADAVYQDIINNLSAEQVPQFKQVVAEQVPHGQDIVGNGEGRAAQSAALQKLGTFVDQNGLDAQARSANQQALSAADQSAKGNRDATMNQYARRGMGGSGTELAASLQANQSSANQARNSSLDIAGQARSRALSALQQQGSLGTSMRGQDIDVESKNAAAEQARQEFNAKMRYGAANANNALSEDDFRNRMAKDNAVNGAKNAWAQRLLQRAKQTQGDYSSMGQAMNYKHQAAADDLEDMPF